jgi:TPP-dependent pyruvate/acetoin dehydrogenase alpha subunit
MNIISPMGQRLELAKEIQRSRAIQLEINNMIIAGEFQIPIHLGIGHEAIATSLVKVLDSKDKLLLTHRNIHYQLALGASKDELIDEYSLKESGLAGGRLGSMNLMNPKAGNIYTSNILGNNLAVSLGVGMASKIREDGGVTWAITGDGAIEEGIFFESVLFASSVGLPIVFLVENNEWSLGTSITERRTEIDLKSFAKSMSVDYLHLCENDPDNYVSELETARINVAQSGRPLIIEVVVQSLGGFYKEEEIGSKRYINYHAGAIRLKPDSDNVFERNSSDPMFVVLDDLKIGK